MSGKVKRLSGIQRQVLGLYRDFLRLAKAKQPEQRESITNAIRHEFRQKAFSIKKTNVLMVEYLLRQGRNRLQMLRETNVTSITYVNNPSSQKTEPKTDA
eukprot:TRINITY_DN3518_c0_g1_i2.p2 TRINITY_DN3518_c0_g1~~TRINITY_DN3518_c0_g1_i2.p2  ORF type:complete len:100 (-),score=18.59 TRINITY_DN3518_c0_g1_i2:345-644(-)